MKVIDLKGLERFKDNLEIALDTKLDNLIQNKTFNAWLGLGETVPTAGTILVYNDRTKENGAYIPDIKIADGKTPVKDLPFLIDRDIDNLTAAYISIVDATSEEIYLLGTSENSNEVKSNSKITMKEGVITAEEFDGTASQAKKVEHTLKIGNYSFDGSTDVEIPIYEGEHTWH